MARVRWMVGTFLMMYGIGTVVGFASYRLLSPFAMWVCVFTLMPVISAFLIYGYLRRMRVGHASSLRESVSVRLGRGDGGARASYVRAHDPLHHIA